MRRSRAGLLQSPARAARLLCAGARRRRRHGASVHGGGARQDSRERGIATLRYQFPYMERGGKRPDPPKLAHAAVRAAVAEAAKRTAGTAADRRRQIVRRPDDVAGAGARAAARRARPRVPRLSAASGRSSRRSERGEHLFDVQVPDAVPAGHARCAGDARSDRAGVRQRWRASDAEALGWTPITPSQYRRRSGRTDAQVMDEDAGSHSRRGPKPRSRAATEPAYDRCPNSTRATLAALAKAGQCAK